MVAKHAYIFTRVTATQNLGTESDEKYSASRPRPGDGLRRGYGEVTARLRRGYGEVGGRLTSDRPSAVRRPPEQPIFRALRRLASALNTTGRSGSARDLLSLSAPN